MKNLIRVFPALSLMALMARPTLAGLAVDFTPTIDVTNGNWSLGWSSPPTAWSPSVHWDSMTRHKRLTQNHDVGIYDSLGNLLASSTVLTTDPLSSWFRFHNIAPLILTGSETYYIMGVTGTENYTYLTNSFVVDPRINFVTNEYFDPPSGVLVSPNNSVGFNAGKWRRFFWPQLLDDCGTGAAQHAPIGFWSLGSGRMEEVQQELTDHYYYRQIQAGPPWPCLFIWSITHATSLAIIRNFLKCQIVEGMDGITTRVPGGGQAYSS